MECVLIEMQLDRERHWQICFRAVVPLIVLTLGRAQHFSTWDNQTWLEPSAGSGTAEEILLHEQSLCARLEGVC